MELRDITFFKTWYGDIISHTDVELMRIFQLFFQPAVDQASDLFHQQLVDHF